MRLPLQRLGVSCAWLLVSACATVPTEQLDLVFATTAATATRSSLGCGRAVAFPMPVSARGLDPEAITLVSWNIHKTSDPGWEGDLKRFATGHSLLLLQEAVLHGELRSVIEGSGHYWNLASAFALDGLPTGVMTAATVPPIGVCSLRQDEPLLRLPKAASVTRYRLAGRSETLLVANIHSVNFTLALDAYVEQLAALVAELANHRGPLILAGDLNTWTDRRRAAVEAAVAALALDEVALAPDSRRRFLGKQVDRVYVRGLETLAARAIEVRSSDHNPVSALLRVSADGG